MWDQRAGSISTTLTTSGLNSDICWSPSGKYFASVSREDGLDIFDMAKPQSPVVSAEVEEMVCSVSWDTGERLLFLSTHQGNVEVYSWPDMEHLTMIPAHSASCNRTALDPRGKVLATGGADATMELWDMEDFSIVRTIDGYDSPLLFIDFSWNGKYIASASDDLDIKIHDAFSGDLVRKVPVDSLTTALEWHPRNLAIAYASAGAANRNSDPTVCIFAPGPKS
ncbi:WD40 repeat-like protein [Martensiomyces pterosporus]|nr:WD40 repeat-like protein [Martensiomyces pterosporus]